MSVNLGTTISVGNEGIAVNLVDGSMSRGVTGSIVFIQRCFYHERAALFVCVAKVETKKNFYRDFQSICSEKGTTHSTLLRSLRNFREAKNTYFASDFHYKSVYQSRRKT